MTVDSFVHGIEHLTIGQLRARQTRPLRSFKLKSVMHGLTDSEIRMARANSDLTLEALQEQGVGTK